MTCIAEAAELPEHLKNRKKLKALEFDRILPNHGDPEVIRQGGYQKTFIDATTDYVTKMLTCAKGPGLSGRPARSLHL